MGEHFTKPSTSLPLAFIIGRMQPDFAIGLDFGTESGRVMLVRLENGEEAAWSVVPYPHGVIERTLPDGTPLGEDWALQDPRDYLEVLSQGVPRVLAESGITPTGLPASASISPRAPSSPP